MTKASTCHNMPVKNLPDCFECDLHVKTRISCKQPEKAEDLVQIFNKLFAQDPKINIKKTLHGNLRDLRKQGFRIIQTKVTKSLNRKKKACAQSAVILVHVMYQYLGHFIHFHYNSMAWPQWSCALGSNPCSCYSRMTSVRDGCGPNRPAARNNIKGTELQNRHYSVFSKLHLSSGAVSRIGLGFSQFPVYFSLVL